MLITSHHLAIVLAYGAGSVSGVAICLGPRWLPVLMPFATALVVGFLFA